jgi:hypothetical protein
MFILDRRVFESPFAVYAAYGLSQDYLPDLQFGFLFGWLASLLTRLSDDCRIEHMLWGSHLTFNLPLVCPEYLICPQFVARFQWAGHIIFSYSDNANWSCLTCGKVSRRCIFLFP